MAAASDTLFALQDPGTDRIIDIRSSFSPAGRLVLLWKMVATLWIFSVICVGVVFNARRGHATKYFYYISNWATVGGFIYSICSLLSSAFATTRLLAVRQQLQSSGTSQQHRPNLWVRFTWVMFEVAAHLGITISLAYWAFHFHSPASHELFYRDVSTHGGVIVVVLLDGLVVNRIPVRLGHFWQYTIWIYAFYIICCQDHSRGGGVDDYTVNNAESYKPAAARFDLSGKLTRFQDQSPQLIYAAILIHFISGVLIVLYGWVIKRIPLRFAYSWQAALWYMVLIAMFSLSDYKTASWIEDVAGRLLPYVLMFPIWGLLHLFLYGLSLLSCFGCSGRNRRYLPVAISNGREDDDDDCVDENEKSVVMIRLV
jgi:hypothetical protein